MSRRVGGTIVRGLLALALVAGAFGASVVRAQIITNTGPAKPKVPKSTEPVPGVEVGSSQTSPPLRPRSTCSPVTSET